MYVVPVRNEPSVVISCPIYYRSVTSGQVSRRLCPLPVCTVRNLPELLHQYCDRKISPMVTFEKTNAWYSGPSWKHGPEFLKRASTSKTGSRSASSVRRPQSALPPQPQRQLEPEDVIPGCYRGLRTSTSRQATPSSLQNRRIDTGDSMGISLPQLL